MAGAVIADGFVLFTVDQDNRVERFSYVVSPVVQHALLKTRDGSGSNCECVRVCIIVIVAAGNVCGERDYQKIAPISELI